MIVVVRADASLQMGTGHIMRCLTLVDALKEQGSEVHFICRKFTGNLITYIESKGFHVHTLEISKTMNIGNSKKEDYDSLRSLYAEWLGDSQENDAQFCKPILQKIQPDWLILDHYSMDKVWEEELKNTFDKLLVIDDLADRHHQCNVLLDQTYGRQEYDYQGLVNKDCKMLLGPQYALLRPEFAKWREYSIKRRAQPRFKNLLITMGGVDPDNVTSHVLDVLKNCELAKDLEVIVVMGATSPHLKAVVTKAEGMPYKTAVKVSVNNMGEIMANADLAIGAAGTTTWERCCLGLPTIQMLLSDNQVEIAKKLDNIGAVTSLNTLEQLGESIVGILKYIPKISLLASSIIDGEGTDRVSTLLCENLHNNNSLLFKPATYSDSNFVYGLQNKEVRKYFRNPEVPSLDEHIDWFNKIINTSESQLFILTLNNKSIGVLRVDGLNNKRIEVSIIVSPDYVGQGLAGIFLKKLEGIMVGRSLQAVIHKHNIASKKVFERHGFKIQKQEADFVEYLKIV